MLPVVVECLPAVQVGAADLAENGAVEIIAFKVILSPKKRE
jgi:hypothetical protein